MSLNCSLRPPIGLPRDIDIVPIYKYLCPVVISICLIGVTLNASLICFCRCYLRRERDKSQVLLLSLNLALTDMIASLMNGLGIFNNSYLYEVFDKRTILNDCQMLVTELIRCTALGASALHLLALALVHYNGIVNPINYRVKRQHSRRINIISLVCWIVPFTVLLVDFAATPCQGFYTGTDECDFSFTLKFQFRSKLVAFFTIPLVIMAVIYLRIFVLISRHQRGHSIKASTLASGVLSASGPVGSAAAMNLPQLMAAAASAGDEAASVPGQGDRDDDDNDDDDDDDDARLMESGGLTSRFYDDHDKADGRVCSICSARETGAASSPAEQRPGNRSIFSPAAVSNNIKFSLDQKTDGAQQQPSISPQNRPVGEQNGRGREANGDGGKIRQPAGNSNTDSNRTCSMVANCHERVGGEKISENLLVVVDGHETESVTSTAAAAAAGRATHSTELVTKMVANNKQLCDQDSNNSDNNGAESPLMGVKATIATTSMERVNHGLDKGLTGGSALSLDERERERGGASKLGDKPDDCCPAGAEIGSGGAAAARGGEGWTAGDPSSQWVNPSRSTPATATAMATAAASAETRRADSCRGQPARVALRAQFSLGPAPPTSPKPPHLAQLRMPSKSSLKKRQQQLPPPPHLTFDQKRREARGDSAEATWECSECDNKLRQSGLRLARTSPSDGQPIAARESRQGTLVTMSITSQTVSSSPGSAATAASASIQTTTTSGTVSLKRPKLCRSMTSGCESPLCDQPNQPNQKQKRPGYFRPANLSRQQSNSTTITRTLTNAGSLVGSSYCEPQLMATAANSSASSASQSKTKAIKTTLLILGTYFFSYIPAIIWQYVTCVDSCSKPLDTIPFSDRIVYGSITSVMVIAKSIIDPLVYSLRMGEVQEAISRYLSKRRSKSSMANSTILQSSQRFPAASATSIYNNNNNNNNNNNSIHHQADNVNGKSASAKQSAGQANSSSLRILNTVKQPHGRTTIRTISSSDDSPSKILAKRFQSFDKYDDYCPLAGLASNNEANSSPNCEQNNNDASSLVSTSLTSSSSNSFPKQIQSNQPKTKSDRLAAFKQTASDQQRQQQQQSDPDERNPSDKIQSVRRASSIKCNGAQPATE